MFIIEPIKKEDATGELKLLYRMIEKTLGFVPPHFELFATIDLEAMKEFLEYNRYMMTHEKIDLNLLPYLRLEIAQKECRTYCIDFNTHMLNEMGVEDFSNPELDDKQLLLMQKVLKAIYESSAFNKTDIDELKALGFVHKDFYDLLTYATNFMAKSKMIEVYLK